MSSGSGGVYGMRLLILTALDSCTILSTILDLRCMVQVEAIYTLVTPVGIVLAGVMLRLQEALIVRLVLS